MMWETCTGPSLSPSLPLSLLSVTHTNSTFKIPLLPNTCSVLASDVMRQLVIDTYRALKIYENIYSKATWKYKDYEIENMYGVITLYWSFLLSYLHCFDVCLENLSRTLWLLWWKCFETVLHLEQLLYWQPMDRMEKVLFDQTKTSKGKIPNLNKTCYSVSVDGGGRLLLNFQKG